MTITTCKAKLEKEHPEEYAHLCKVGSDFFEKCPSDYGYPEHPCYDEKNGKWFVPDCEKCWNHVIYDED